MEILEAFLPKVNVNHLTNTTLQLSYLALYLPTELVPSKPSTLNPTEDLPPFYWVPALYQLWLLFVNAPTIDSIFLDLFARLSKDQVATPLNVNFSQEQMKWMFSVGLKSMDLPVGSGSTGLQSAPIRGMGQSSTGGPSNSGGSDLSNRFTKVRDFPGICLVRI
jgi:hypothetical protein